MTTPVCTIDATGIHAPEYVDCLNYYVGQYQAIYGSDIYLGNDSQDFQWLSIQALALHDANMAQVAAFNSFSPTTAQGAGLSSVVKINGIQRLVPTNSTVDQLIVGQVGTEIINGYTVDANKNQWLLPPLVIIPISGQITVTATAAVAGQIAAPPGTVNQIGTPTLGWQTVTNQYSAVPGQPVEQDGTLRQRQSVSTALPSQTVLDGIVGELSNLVGVVAVAPYVNDTPTTDSNGIPANSVCFVVEGGDAQSIANVIALKKSLGCGTYGSTVETFTSTYGIPEQIYFQRPTTVAVDATVHITALQGYTTAIGLAIVAAVRAYLGSLSIGDDVFWTRVLSVAAAPAQGSAHVTGVTIARSGGAQASADIVLAFSELSVAGNVVSAIP